MKLCVMLVVLGCAGCTTGGGGEADDGAEPEEATHQATVTVLPGQADQTVAECDDGELLLRGGCRWGQTPGAVTPTLDAAPDFGTAQAWACGGYVAPGSPAQRVTAWATCVADE